MSTVRDNITHTARYLPLMAVFLWEWAWNKPLIWVDPNGEVVATEQWTRGMYWTMRPMYLGFINNLPCGCTRRFGRIILYRLGCPENHGGLSDLDLALDKFKNFDFQEPGQ